MRRKRLLIPIAVVGVAITGLLIAFPFGGQVAADHDYWHTFTGSLGTNSTGPGSNTTATPSTATTFNDTLDCAAIASDLGGIGIPSGKVCDVVVVRKTPSIMGHDGLVQNQFTLMNSVLEFLPVANNVTGASEVYVMGDFALLETEMNDVLGIVSDNEWTVTGIHNHMINETPKTSFMHWEVRGDIDSIIADANEALAATSIKG